MVSLMDRLLKKENLDLKLTPYRVLATSSDDGMMEFVPSVALATVRLENLVQQLEEAAFSNAVLPPPSAPFVEANRRVPASSVYLCPHYFILNGISTFHVPFRTCGMP